jgi:hypothetical protein
MRQALRRRSPAINFPSVATTIGWNNSLDALSQPFQIAQIFPHTAADTDLVYRKGTSRYIGENQLSL